MVKVVLFGYGHLGRWHADKVMALKESELVAVVDPNLETPQKFKTHNLDVAHYNNLESVNCDFDAAIVATPTSLHFEICKELLIKGKHVFCEKPMTSTFDQALELEALAKDQKVVFQVGHSERFHSIWAEVKKEEEFFKGKPIFHLERQAPFKGRATDVDVVQDLMIHDLDIMLFLLDEMPQSIKAFGKKMRTDKWDYAEAHLEYSSGVVAVLKVGRNYVKEVRNFEIVNDAGTLQVDLFKKKLFIASSKAQGEYVVEKDYEARDHLLEEQKAFYRAIKGEGEIPVTIEDGRSAVFLVEKVLAAIESGKTEQC
jgi:predicted dehydrogenase